MPGAATMPSIALRDEMTPSSGATTRVYCERELLTVQPRVGRFELRFRGAAARQILRGVLLAQRAGFAEPFGALRIGLRFGDVRFGFGDGRFGLPDHRERRRVVESREQLPLRNLVTDVDHQFGETQAGDFGADDRFLPRARWCRRPE